MSVLAVYSIKGGVGKTTTALNLAWVAASQGQRVLLWDLDPQGAASYCLRVEAKVRGGAKRVLNNKHGLAEHIKASDYDELDLLPSDFSYRHMDAMLDDMKQPRKRLRQVLDSVLEDYDLVVLDCAPSISMVSENVFRAVDLLLVPLIPTPLSMRTLDQLEEHLMAERSHSGRLKKLKLAAFFSMADGRRRLHKDTIAASLGQRSSILRTVIPYASDVELMTARRAPLPSYAPRNHASLAYHRLWAEVFNILS